MSENNQLAGKSSDPKDHIKTMSVKNYVSLAQKCPHMCVCIYRYIYNHFYKSYYRRGLCSPFISYVSKCIAYFFTFLHVSFMQKTQGCKLYEIFFKKQIFFKYKGYIVVV